MVINFLISIIWKQKNSQDVAHVTANKSSEMKLDSSWSILWTVSNIFNTFFPQISRLVVLPDYNEVWQAFLLPCQVSL